MSLTDRFIKGASFSVVGAVTTRGAFFLNSVILARHLGTADFGVFNIIYSLINSLVIFTLFGLNITLIKFISEFMIRDKEKIGGFILSAFCLCFIISLLVSGGYFALSQKLSTDLYSKPSLAELIRISALGLIFLTWVNLGNSIIQGFQEFKLFALTSIATSILVVPITLLFLVRWGLKGAITALVFLFFSNCLFLLSAIRRIFRSREITLITKGFLNRQSELIMFALPVFLSGVIVAPATWLGNTFLARSHGFSEVGIFNIAQILSQLVVFLPLVILTPVLPIFSEVQAMGDYQRLSTVVSRNLKYIWLLTLPIVTVVSSLSQVLILRIYGSQYGGSFIPTFLMLWTALFIVMNNVIGVSIISDSKRIWHAFGLNLLWFLFFLSSSYLFTLWKGALGLAIAFSFSYVIFSCAMYIYSVRYLRLGNLNLYGFIGTTFVSGVITFFLSSQINGLELWIITFFLLVLLLWVEWRFFLNSEEKSRFYSLLSGFKLF